MALLITILSTSPTWFGPTEVVTKEHWFNALFNSSSSDKLMPSIFSTYLYKFLDSINLISKCFSFLILLIKLLSISTNIGFAPYSTIGLTLAVQVQSGTIISSPFLIPRVLSVK